MSGPDTALDSPRPVGGVRGARPLRTGDALAQLGFADIDPVPAAGGAGRAGGLRGAGPIRRGDPLSKRGFADVLAAGAPLGEAGCTERLAAAGPHPAAVLDPAESAALADRIRRA